MARRNAATAEAPESTEVTEAPAEVESTEATTEAPAEKVEPDLTAFNTVVAEVLGTRDTSTGVVPVEGKSAVTAAWRELDGDGKRAAKKVVEAGMMEAVGNVDGPLARAYSEVKNSLTSVGGKAATSTPADPTAAYVSKEAALRLALDIHMAGRPEVEGIEDKVNELVNGSADLVKAQTEYLADESEDKGDGPELTPVVRSAFKLAQGKAAGGGRTSGSSGPRGDIGKHIVEVFADKDSGTELKISEVAKVKTSEYPNGNASQGAISARLFPAEKNTVPGVEPIEKDDTGPRRVRKSA